MPRHDGSRDLWNNDERRAPNQFDPSWSPQSRDTGRRAGDRNWFKSAAKLALLVVVVAAAWHWTKPLVARYRSSNDIEDCAGNALRRLPAKAASEAELRAAVAQEIADALTTHHSLRARWYVCLGPRGDAVRVVRDDTFSPTEKAFVERLIDEGRLRTDVAGSRHDVFLYPLGATYSTVVVDGVPWCVAIGWSEKR